MFEYFSKYLAPCLHDKLISVLSIFGSFQFTLTPLLLQLKILDIPSDDECDVRRLQF